jgi:hypothetical protein
VTNERPQLTNVATYQLQLERLLDETQQAGLPKYQLRPSVRRSIPNFMY